MARQRDTSREKGSEGKEMTSHAAFSPCRLYRYTLWRSWNGISAGEAMDNYVNFICLNPSTADETKDDNTIRKCVRLAKLWGFDAMCVTNLFGYRSTDPEAMKKVQDPVGPENNLFIEQMATNAKVVVAAWSRHGSHQARSAAVKLLLRGTPLYCLRMGKTGEPWHPLYLPDNSQPIFWYQ
jgi:hypothetical protein